MKVDKFISFNVGQKLKENKKFTNIGFLILIY